jgi:acetoin utilization deacetylase AcuC-like enzyme
MRTVGFVTHEAASLHEMVRGHPERPERIAAIRAHLDATGLLDGLEPHTPERATRDVLELVHRPELLDVLDQADRAGGGVVLDRDVTVGTHSLEAALRGTQGAVDSVERVLSGEWSSAFVCTRPPGHHATPAKAMGFCLTNHVAVAARWAVSTGRAARVAILDFDAHHGNGTQDAFWADPNVLYASLHQFPWYPGSGDATDCGAGEGYGSTVNVPLPAGAAEDAYERALDEVIEPGIDAFGPDLVLVSAGYDAHHADPLCMMRLTAGAFFRMLRRAEGWGAGPVCVLEGGYDLAGLALSVGATLSAMLGMEEPAGISGREAGPIEGHPEAGRWVDRAAALRRAAAG